MSEKGNESPHVRARCDSAMMTIVWAFEHETSDPEFLHVLKRFQSSNSALNQSTSLFFFVLVELDREMSNRLVKRWLVSLLSRRILIVQEPDLFV